MDKESVGSPVRPVPVRSMREPEVLPNDSPGDGTSKLSAAGISSWAKSFKMPHSLTVTPEDSPTVNGGKSAFARFASGIGLRLSPSPSSSPSLSPTSPFPDYSPTEISEAQPSFFGTITKGLVDSSKNAVKAVQVKARHVVSQNKRRYQEGGFDLDMTYITENIIAMGFPAGDMSSGFFGYVEGFYRNHMEEVIKFFETHHKGKYKVYNLCSERLYDASLFEGKVACFPFDDHNCPPIHLITSFCQSAYAWLKEDIENVVVVHCKAGMARTGLMISSLLLFLKFFPTAEESMDYYNQKRCVDGKGLVLPSQIRYVKYFERVLTYFNGEIPPGRRCLLRGFRLHRCPYWIRPSITVSDHNGVLFTTKKHPRTKDLSPEDYWFSAPKKGVMVFALPGEPGLTQLAGDFKVHFHDRQGDFYCWLNTTFVENRKILNTGDLDGFDKRKLPSPGFQVEVVLVDYDGTIGSQVNSQPVAQNPSMSSEAASVPPPEERKAAPQTIKEGERNDRDDVFSDSEAEEGSTSKSKRGIATSGTSGVAPSATSVSITETNKEQVSKLTHETERMALGGKDFAQPKTDASVSQPNFSSPESEFKAMAADASVFSFGDEEDLDSD